MKELHSAQNVLFPMSTGRGCLLIVQSTNASFELKTTIIRLCSKTPHSQTAEFLMCLNLQYCDVNVFCVLLVG